ncbi:succinate dehydrogenase cytochrome b small subunit [Desmospora sp. 8437]|nr:succinate dehydrogenase cytochrome b small subunit [Desmospora sp. 8437]
MDDPHIGRKGSHPFLIKRQAALPASPFPIHRKKGGKSMSGYYGYGFGLGRLLIFLLVIATIFALVGIWGY